MRPDKTIKREDKYFVLKQEDLDDFFSDYTKGLFTTDEEKKVINKIPFFDVVQGIEQNRKLRGKKMNKYIVCNQDEPYADLVWETILQGERCKRVFAELKRKLTKEDIEELENTLKGGE